MIELHQLNSGGAVEPVWINADMIWTVHPTEDGCRINFTGGTHCFIEAPDEVCEMIEKGSEVHVPSIRVESQCGLR